MEIYEGYSTQSATVMEMTEDGVDTVIDVPVASDVLAKLREDDTDPVFVTIEVLNEGVSKNGRKWDKETIYSVAEQINEKRPDGYYGHLKDEERSSKYPEPQTIWIGAKVEEVGGKVRLFAKGYVLPEAKTLRSYLKKAKSIGKNVAVSVYGTADAVMDKAKGYMRMQNFILESIDWARPGSEGVKNMGLFQVTSEMKQSNGNKRERIDMDREEAIKSATADELKELNPVVSEMIGEAVSDKDEELQSVVSEMADIRSTLGLKEDASVKETVSEMKSELTALRLDNELREKVEVPAARKFIKELVVAEMNRGTSIDTAIDKVLESETGKTLISEMIETAPKVSPRVEQPVASTRRFTKQANK